MIDCVPCATARVQGYWGDSVDPGMTHCRDCHSTHSGKSLHCTVCHATIDIPPLREKKRQPYIDDVWKLHIEKCLKRKVRRR